MFHCLTKWFGKVCDVLAANVLIVQPFLGTIKCNNLFTAAGRAPCVYVSVFYTAECKVSSVNILSKVKIPLSHPQVWFFILLSNQGNLTGAVHSTYRIQDWKIRTVCVVI